MKRFILLFCIYFASSINGFDFLWTFTPEQIDYVYTTDDMTRLDILLGSSTHKLEYDI